MRVKKGTKIALLSPFFYPEKISTGKYNAALVEAMVSQGANVHVICSHPLYPKWKPARSNDSMKGVTIHRGGMHVHYPRENVLRRIILESWFTMHTLIKLYPIRKEIDTVVAIFPPVLFMLAAKLKQPV